jgi:hypothetical protein
LQQI